MEGLEILTGRFESWKNLVGATAILEKEETGTKYDCNWCNSGCGGCAGCGDNSYLSQELLYEKGFSTKGAETKDSYSCQGCDGCDGCNGCD